LWISVFCREAGRICKVVNEYIKSIEGRGITMDKLAMVKLAEVNGVLAGLVDEGLIKISSDEEFDALSELVSDNLDDEYDMDDILNKTAEVMQAADELEEMMAGEDMEKSAEELIAEEVTPLLAEYGHLALLKEAEEITDQDYEEETGKLKKALNAVGSHVSKNKRKYIAGGTTAAALAALGYGANRMGWLEKLRKAMKKTQPPKLLK
jgi:hypothetical protein